PKWAEWTASISPGSGAVCSTKRRLTKRKARSGDAAYAASRGELYSAIVHLAGRNPAEMRSAQRSPRAMPSTRPHVSLRAAAAGLPGAALVVAGCAPGLGSGTCSRGQVGQIGRTDAGVVVEARPAMIEGTKSGIGSGAGAVIGAAGGSQIGQGDA